MLGHGSSGRFINSSNHPINDHMQPQMRIKKFRSILYKKKSTFAIKASQNDDQNVFELGKWAKILLKVVRKLTLFWLDWIRVIISKIKSLTWIVISEIFSQGGANSYRKSNENLINRG